MKYEKAKVVEFSLPRERDKINKTINEGIKNGWQPINISTTKDGTLTQVFVLMGKLEEE